MIASTQEKIKYNDNVNSVDLATLTEYFSIEQLIDLIISLKAEESCSRHKQDLVNRGKDDISNRIKIKKACKSSITNLEMEIKKAEDERPNKKEEIKQLRTRFLSIISIMDKLQLEWQRHDLGLN